MFDRVKAKVKKAVVMRAAQVLEKHSGSSGWLQSAVGSEVPMSFPWNYWQSNMTTPADQAESFAPVQTAQNIIAQDISRLTMTHVEKLPSGGTRIITDRAPARLFRNPTPYYTQSEWLLYLLISLLTEGNAYFWRKRNDRFEVTDLYPIHPKSCWPYIEPGTGEVFYRMGSHPTTQLAMTEVEAAEWFPARDILHIRGRALAHPLIGETPLVALAFPLLAGQSINQHNATFFANMSRPSGLLRHPGQLDEDGMKRVKQRFMELTQGGRTGEPVVLSENMDWTSLTMSAVDAEVAKIYQLNERQIFGYYRIPSFLSGDLDKSNLANVESLTRFYLQSCLGFWVRKIEDSMTKFLGMPMNEQVQFDVETAFLRGDLKERMEALGKGVQNFIYSPNEARAREGLPPKKDGDDPRGQQQLVPLSYGMNLQPPQPGGGAPMEPVKPDNDDDDSDDADDSSEDKAADNYTLLKQLLED